MHITLNVFVDYEPLFNVDTCHEVQNRETDKKNVCHELKNAL